MDVSCKCSGIRPEMESQLIPLYLAAWQPSPGDHPMYDGPDLPTDDLPEDLTGPEPQAEPIDIAVLNRIVGYETVGYYPDNCAPYIPPPPLDAPYRHDVEESTDKKQTFNNTAHINEFEARSALLGYVSQNCCFGKSAAKEMKINKILPSSAFLYTLETYIETRTTSWEKEPYTGQPIDGPMNGRAPLPWEIHCFPTQMFHDEVHLLEVPHTAEVAPCCGCDTRGWIRCYNCLGRGFKRCISCSGSGRCWKADAHGHRHVDSCWRCHGTGRKRCPSCAGDGRIVCRTCQGYKHLKCYINLRIEYTIHLSEHVVEHSDMPSHLVRDVSGEVVLDQTQPRVWPVSDHQEKELCTASEALLNEHLTRFHYARIIMQRQRLKSVPVAECQFSWKKLEGGRFWVYGNEQLVHAPDYPQKICCGCVLM